MHIPDNYLSPETCLVMGAAMVPVLIVSVHRVKKTMSAKRLPLIGIGAALSFVLMMFNVPVPGGTTAHAVGGTLLAILLGPEAACLAIAAALLIQCLFFGDGGVLALGANMFNMAFVMPFFGYAVYRLLTGRQQVGKRRLVAAAIAAYLAINVSALLAGIEFGIQPMLFTDAGGRPLYAPYPLQVAVPAMLIPHLSVAGAAEILATGGVLTFVQKVSPELLGGRAPRTYKKLTGLLLALIMLTPLGLLAAASAWGEWSGGELAHTIGYLPAGMTRGFDYHALFSDYAVRGLPEWLGYILSAAGGCAVLVILFRLLSFRKKKDIRN